MMTASDCCEYDQKILPLFPPMVSYGAAGGYPRVL